MPAGTTAGRGGTGQGQNAPRLRQRERVPADILLIWWDKGRHVAVDFVITHPLQPHLPRSVERAARHLKAAEEEKVRSEGDLCTQSGWGFAPASFSPWGAMGPNAAALLYELSRRATSNLVGWRRTKR